VRALFPNNPEVACYAVCFTLSMNLLVFTLGVFCLTGEKRYVSVKHAVFNPSVLGLVIGLPLYLLGWGSHLPTLLTEGIVTLGGLTTPLCMFILGIRLASTKPKILFSDSTAYLVSALKLVAFPLFCLLVGKLFSPDAAFYGSLVILAATPCAAIILSLAEIYHSREQTSASCILLSMLSCILTIPLLALTL
jgi:predicted permease